MRCAYFAARWIHTPNIGAEITTEPRINDRIRTPQIRLINYTGEQIGVLDIEAALAMADEIGL
ncbi:MAG: hypothetical protein RL381_220, partial [Actinomycetota bacterium]